jgi:hypothetical protein
MSRISKWAALWLLILHAANAAEMVRTFPLVATDAKGQPVTDLRPAEIQVEVAGKRTPAAFLRFLPARKQADGATFSGASTLILLDLFNGIAGSLTVPVGSHT